MGQRTDPGYELFGDDCLACFDADKTPKLMFVEFANITWQDSAPPSLPGPLQMSFVLEQIDANPCIWDGGVIGKFWCRFKVNLAPGSSLELWFNIYRYFLSIAGANCVYQFDNQQVINPPFDLGEDGQARIWTRPGVDLPSLKHIMELINMNPERKNWHDGFPIDAQYSVSRYVRKQDATNIKIKFDHT